MIMATQTLHPLCLTHCSFFCLGAAVAASGALQDVRLPESSVHDFARDMVVALQFLHANSIIYCDIKPSNVLLDENGRLKLGGFGLSRRLSDINKNPVADLPPVSWWGQAQPLQSACLFCALVLWVQCAWRHHIGAMLWPLYSSAQTSDACAALACSP
eukprot:GHRQ01018345.1.p1 GENE.GHRQ01018345.1~~GHRQ01018345.1.p1  ORF type:complete len:158 (-),score=25.04 GHRQ01018345.1:113-586(-)